MSSFNILIFTATEKVEVEILITEQYFSLNCKSVANLERLALPRFDCPRTVDRGFVVGCAAPQGGYAALLRAINVTPRSALTLANLPAVNLTRAHFVDLPPLNALHVRHARRPSDPRIQADFDFLSPLNESLRSLTLLAVALTPETLRALPQGLEELDISDAALQCKDGCEVALRRLQQLHKLRLTDKQLHAALALPAATALRLAYVFAPLRQSLLSRETTIENATFLYVLPVDSFRCFGSRHCTVPLK